MVSSLRLAAAMLALFVWVWAHGGALTVGPDPEAYDFVELEAAVAAARPGDEVVIAPGRYALHRGVYIGASITLRAAGEVVLERSGSGSGDLVHVGEGTAHLVGLTFRGGGVGMSQLAEIHVQECVFEDCAVGVDGGDGVVEVTGSRFTGCRIGVRAGRWARVRDSTFHGCQTGVVAAAATTVTLDTSTFSANGIGVSGEHPCQVTGSGNLFSRNGLDLAGDVEPSLRVPQREGTEAEVTYPGGDHGTLQQAVDALTPGGRLMLGAAVAESATLDKPLTVEPAGPETVRINGARFGEEVLPAFSIVGDGEVELRRLTAGEIVCGPRIRLSLKDVRVDHAPLFLTGQAVVVWDGGAGGLQLDREAGAQVSGVILDRGIRLGDLSHACLTDCEVGLRAEATGVAVRLTGLSRLEADRVSVWGGVSVQERGKLVLRSSHLAGPSADGFRRVLSVDSFADVWLHDVIVEGGRAGIMLSSWGRPHLTLDGVTVRDCEVGLAVDIRCPEFAGIYGLWLPPLTLEVTLGPRGLEFISCGVGLCPLCSDGVWPTTLCQALEMATSDAAFELLGSAGRGEGR